MIQLRYVGNYKPKGMIVEVEESEVERLLKSGEYEKVCEEKEVKEEKPNKKWTEMQIYDWIKSHNIPIKYDPRTDREADILKKLKDKGYI